MTVDWTILQEDNNREVAERAARSVFRLYSELELNDLIQEAFIAMATHSAEYRPLLASGDVGLVYHRIWCDLMNHARSQTDRTKLNVSRDALLAEEGE